MENLTRLLAEHPFLEGLPSRHLEFIHGCAANVRFEGGEFLFREGGPADRIYLLRQGEVALQVYDPSRGAVTLTTVGPGDVVGWSWVVEPYLARFDAIALEPIRAFALDAKCLRERCDADHELGYEMLSRVAVLMERRLQAARLQLLDLYDSR